MLQDSWPPSFQSLFLPPISPWKFWADWLVPLHLSSSQGSQGSSSGCQACVAGTFSHGDISLASLSVFLGMSYNIWTQIGFRLPMQLKMGLNSWSSCLYILSAGIAGPNHTQTPSLFQTALICIMVKASCSVHCKSWTFLKPWEELRASGSVSNWRIKERTYTLTIGFQQNPLDAFQMSGLQLSDPFPAEGALSNNGRQTRAPCVH